MNLTELVESVREADETFEEIIAPATALEIGDEELRIEGRSFSFNAEARSRIYLGVGAPSAYLSKLSLRNQSAVLTEVLNRGDSGKRVSVAVRGNEVYTICRGDLIRLHQHDVVVAIMDGLGESAHTLTLTRIATDGDRFDLEVATPRKSIDVRSGDVVQGGLHVVHSRFGEEATVVEMFTYRLVCTNGMIHRSCPSNGGAARTRKLPLNHANGRELQVEQIRRLTTQTWDRLEPVLVELQATRERQADVEGLLTGWLQRARISVGAMMPRLKEAWQQDGGEKTQYGAINALTRVATHDETLTTRQRRVLSSLAGLLAFSNVHICPRCLTVLSQGGTRGEDS